MITTAAAAAAVVSVVVVVLGLEGLFIVVRYRPTAQIQQHSLGGGARPGC